MTSRPGEIAHELLSQLYDELSPGADFDQRLQLAQLAAQVEIADRLAGIERSLDTGIAVNSV